MATRRIGTTPVTAIPTGGKVVVNAPEFLQEQAHLRPHRLQRPHRLRVYEQALLHHNADNSVGGCFVANLGTSHHVDEVGPLDQLKLQLNVINLLGRNYLATIGTTVFIASDPTSISNNTLRPWAPRSVTRTFSMRF